METPLKDYFSLPEAESSYDCTVDELVHFAEVGKIKLSIKAILNKLHAFFLNDPEYGLNLQDGKGLFDIGQSSVFNIIRNSDEYFEIDLLITNEYSFVNLYDGKEYYEYKYNIDGPLEIMESSISVNFKDLIVRKTEIDLLFNKNVKVKTGMKSSLPKELDCALLTYSEFWENRPQNKNPAREEDINSFIKGKMGGHVSEAALDRIRTISRPENERKGGAHSVEKKTYKGKSKENT